MMHASWSMKWVLSLSPLMALAGQKMAQAVQPVHFSGSMTYLMRGLQTFAGQRPFMCSMYSSLK